MMPATSRLLAGLLLLAASLGSVPLLAAPIDQAGWIVRKQMVTLPNGQTLAYVELGDPKGEPLLLLHGYTDTSRTWTALAPQLARYRLLIPDLRGHGQSAKPECCYALEDAADDMRLFLDAKGVRRAHVAGHSWGSMIAQALAAAYPERVGKLVLIGSTGRAAVSRDGYLWKNVMAMRAPVSANAAFLKEWSPTQSPTPVDFELARWNDKEIAEVPLHVWRAVPRALLDVPVGRYGADIKAPVLILSGGKDALFDSSHHQALLSAIPHAQGVVLPDLGHNLILERPHEVGPVILRFLAQ